MRGAVAWLAVLMGHTLVAGIVAAQDAPSPQTIIERAIQAKGGAARLIKLRQLRRAAHGTMTLFGKQIPFTSELTVAFPDRLHDEIQVQAKEQHLAITRVVNGDQGWVVGVGAAQAMSKGVLTELREELDVLWLTTLLPLEEKASELSPLPPGSVEGTPVLGVQVTRSGHPPAKLSFDRRDYRLVAIEQQVPEAGAMVNKRYRFSEPRPWEGIWLPMKEVIRVTPAQPEGKHAAGDNAPAAVASPKTVVLSITRYEFPDKLDDKLFGRP